MTHGPSSSVSRKRRQACDGGSHGDVAEHVQRAEMRAQRVEEKVVEHLSRAPSARFPAAAPADLPRRARVPRFDRFENFFHLHAARAFQQQQIARAARKPARNFAGLLGIVEKLRPVAGCPASTAALHEFLRIALHAENPVDLAKFRRRRGRIRGAIPPKTSPARAFRPRPESAGDIPESRRASAPARSAPSGLEL